MICGEGYDKALERAEAYLSAGVDGIMIHSKSQSPEEVLKFAERYHKLDFPYGKKPLMAIPTTYHKINEKELINAGFNIVVYANHQLRSAYKAMEKVCKNILENDRGREALSLCASLKEILEPVGSSRTYNAEYKTKINKDDSM